MLDLLYHAELLIELLDGFDEQRFRADIRTQLAVTRLFEILGEAVKRLTPDFRDAHPELPWRQLAGMRDVLIHSYDAVDLTRVWNAATTDTPAFLEALRAIASAKEN